MSPERSSAWRAALKLASTVFQVILLQVILKARRLCLTSPHPHPFVVHHVPPSTSGTPHSCPLPSSPNALIDFTYVLHTFPPSYLFTPTYSHLTLNFSFISTPSPSYLCLWPHLPKPSTYSFIPSTPQSGHVSQTPSRHHLPPHNTCHSAHSFHASVPANVTHSDTKLHGRHAAHAPTPRAMLTAR